MSPDLALEIAREYFKQNPENPCLLLGEIGPLPSTPSRLRVTLSPVDIDRIATCLGMPVDSNGNISFTHHGTIQIMFSPIE